MSRPVQSFQVQPPIPGAELRSPSDGPTGPISAAALASTASNTPSPSASTDNSGQQLTSFAVLPDAALIAVGFASGAVLLFSGPFLQEGRAGALMPQVLLPNYPYPVAQLFFCERPKSGVVNNRQVNYSCFSS